MEVGEERREADDNRKLRIENRGSVVGYTAGVAGHDGPYKPCRPRFAGWLCRHMEVSEGATRPTTKQKITDRESWISSSATPLGVASHDGPYASWPTVHLSWVFLHYVTTACEYLADDAKKWRIEYIEIKHVLSLRWRHKMCFLPLDAANL